MCFAPAVPRQPGLFVVPFGKVWYTVARDFIGNEVHL